MNKRVLEEIQKMVECDYGANLFANILEFYTLGNELHFIVSVWANNNQNLDCPDYTDGTNITDPFIIVFNFNNEIIKSGIQAFIKINKKQ